MKTAIKDGLAQNDFDFASRKAKNADLSAYAGAGLSWNDTTKKFDASGSTGGAFANVKDYGAVGDGVTDDTDAINAAINDVVLTKHGGTLFFPRGAYLCDGAFTAYNDILHIPTLDAEATSAVSIVLQGEMPPPWSVAFTFDETRNSTIKTTKTGTGVTDAALLSGNVSFAGLLSIPYTDMSNVRLTIRNMSFIVPDNPSIHGLRLDAIGWVTLEDCRVFAGDAVTEPMTPTVGIWMPRAVNFGLSYVNRVWVAGFDTGFRAGELFKSIYSIAYYNKTGYEFIEGHGPSMGMLGPSWCAIGVKFSGKHYGDFTFLTEHAAASDWRASVHDISDPSNNATGLIRYFIANGNSGANIIASVDGGAGLTLQSLFSGDLRLAPGSGAGGSTGGAKFLGIGAIPPGGTAGQSLKKLSNTSYDYAWQ